MSRLWSRFGLRTLSIGLLVVAVVGGVALARDRGDQESDDVAVTAEALAAQRSELKERAASRAVATSRQRAAQREAAEKADAEARSAATQARRVDDAATRKKAEIETKKANGYTGPIPASCNEYSGNRKIGCAILLDKGYGIDQMPCLDKLWSKESGWNPKAHNTSSGAYGIPQALPGSKMVSAGADWETNPATQIRWGLGYIKDRYSTPCGAWQHSQNSGWY